ncbi:MAG: hypothetical protein ACRD5J_19860 [Nitrososphaeraceae archaeon]
MIPSLREIGLEATIYDIKGGGKDKQKLPPAEEVGRLSWHIQAERLLLLL